MNIIADQKRLREIIPIFEAKEKIDFVLLNETASILFSEMKEHNGQGLAANQLGLDLRMFVIKRSKYSPICIVNPEITREKGHQSANEGCLSLPGVIINVKRPLEIRVKGFNQYFRQVIYKFIGIEARRACHEIDHLNGKLIIDYE